MLLTLMMMNHCHSFLFFLLMFSNDFFKFVASWESSITLTIINCTWIDRSLLVNDMRDNLWLVINVLDYRFWISPDFNWLVDYMLDYNRRRLVMDHFDHWFWNWFCDLINVIIGTFESWLQ